jgi:transposase-like protein
MQDIIECGDIAMALHFLLSAKAPTLSLKAIYKAGEEGAYETFCQMRWAETDGEPVCPRCGGLDAYKITTRRKFKCRECLHQFSVTSGTIFASRKMAFVDLLAAICIFVNGAKGISALQLSRDLDCQHKTAFVLSHKLREAMASDISGQKLDTEVEIDGAYFGGHIRPANHAEHQTGKRRVVIALRQRGGRTLPFVGKSEAEGVGGLPRGSQRAPRSSMRTRQAIGMRCTARSKPTASTTRKPIPLLACPPIRWSPTSPGFAGWSPVSTTTFLRSTSTSTPITRLGLRIIAAWTTARWRIGW